MGKIENQTQIPETQIDIHQPPNECCSCTFSRIGRACSLRCLVVLLLSTCLSLSALFWLPPFHVDSRIHFPDAVDAPVQASFNLPKPVEMLMEHTRWLEHDINDEIGVPNTKVSIIAMNSLAENWTNVVFGVFPVPMGAPISPVALSVLRSSLVELVLQQSNLSLTTIFGQPSSFEVLEFLGGITVIPVQFSSIWMPPQILFNFTLNNSISQILENINQLKHELTYGLQLRSYEIIYVKVTNMDGSTVSPPVIVQASVLSDLVGHIILPQRLKQLAEALTGHPPKNLGLDHAVFGKVKQIRLSSFLEQSLAPQGSPSPSPAPSAENHHAAPPEPHYPAFTPSYAPASPADSPSPCVFCYSSAPESASAPAPSSISPTPGVTTGDSPRNSPWPSPRISPKPCLHAHSYLPAPRGLSLRSDPPRGELPRSAPKTDPNNISPSPVLQYGSSPLDQRFGGGPYPMPASSPISSSSISYDASPAHSKMWIIGLLAVSFLLGTLH